MSSSDLVRWSGLAAVAGGVLFVVAGLLDFTLPGGLVERAATGTFVVQQLLFLLATVLLLLGLFGLYTSQSEAAGVLGVVGFLLAFFGTALLVGVWWMEVFFWPFIPPQALDFIGMTPWGTPLSGLTCEAGWLVFGIATLRAGVYPRAAAIVLIVGAVLHIIGFLLEVLLAQFFIFLPGLPSVFGIGVAWLGFVLFAGRVASTEQPSRVS